MTESLAILAVIGFFVALCADTTSTKRVGVAFLATGVFGLIGAEAIDAFRAATLSEVKVRAVLSP